MKEAYAHVSEGRLYVEIKKDSGHVDLKSFGESEAADLRTFFREHGVKDVTAVSSTLDFHTEYGWPEGMDKTHPKDLLDFGLDWAEGAVAKGIQALRLVLVLQSMTEKREASTSSVLLDPKASEQVLEALKGLEGL